MEKIFNKPELLVCNGSRYSKKIITCTKCGHTVKKTGIHS